MVFFEQDFAQIIFAGTACLVWRIGVGAIIGGCFFAPAAVASTTTAAAATAAAGTAIFRSFGLRFFSLCCRGVFRDFGLFFILCCWFGAGVVPDPAVDFVPIGFVVAGTGGDTTGTLCRWLLSCIATSGFGASRAVISGASRSGLFGSGCGRAASRFGSVEAKIVFFDLVFFVVVSVFFVLVFFFEVEVFVANVFCSNILFVFIIVRFVVFVAEDDQIVEIFIVGVCCRSGCCLSICGGVEDIAGCSGCGGLSGLVIVVVEQDFTTEIARRFSHIQEWVCPSAGTVFRLFSCFTAITGHRESVFRCECERIRVSEPR